MNWNHSVWLYCERGTSTDILAEPLNAAVNIFYFIAGFAALWVFRRLPYGQRSADHTLFIGLTFVVGIGSLTFHLFARQWSELLHMLPLLIFMMVFLAFALNRFLEMPSGWAVLLISLFVLATAASLTMTCFFLDAFMQPPWSMKGDIAARGATSCLNGSGGYLPSVLALGLLAYVLRARGHKAAGSLMLATGLFFASLVFLAVDHLFCAQLSVRGHQIGTHFIWHGLNAGVLFLLLRASMVYQNRLPVQEIIPPDPKTGK